MGGERVEATEEDAALVHQDTRRELSFDGREVVSTPVPVQRVLPPGSMLGGGRFEVLQRIGQGGMGAVYEAFDAERQQRVALKALTHGDPRGVQQFNREFSALSSIHHPGIVRLHELFAEGDVWFFTMDLIRGQRFDRWARPGGALDERRLRRGLRQLVVALRAIHAANKLHRDVKSSNVLVTAEERVVVLDLGLVAEIGKGDGGQLISELVMAGTPEYMAPEQAFGFPLTSASDFYGMGVMLFEALTGRLPFGGQLGAILAAKQREPDHRALLSTADPPKDLAELCLALLARDPARRPTAAEMLDGSCLLDEPRAAVLAPETPRPLPFSALLGRSAELSLLWAALRETQNGQAVLVDLSGESGVGKTELCSSFLEQVRAEQLATVLAARCHERAAVPYEAVAPLACEIGRQLRKLRPDEAAELLSREAPALARLFPVLARSPGVAEAVERAPPDVYQLQRRACAGFAALLARLRDRHPLIVLIDDAHWMDADSAVLLRHVLVDRGLRPLLFILSRRSEGTAQPRVLEQLFGVARNNPALSLRPLAVEPLPTAEAEALALQLLCHEGPLDVALCRSIALESRGSPFVVRELVRLGRASGAASERASVSDVISARVQGQSETARRLLEAVALVAQPIRVRVALDATAASRADVEALLAAHLLRASDADGHELIECHHDRIREAIADGMALDATRLHYRGLAAALSRDSSADPELASRAWEGAGERAEAARHAVIAADRASLATAFEQAAALYRRALDLGAAGDPSQAELASRQALALEHAGRGPEAAAAYQQVAELTSGEASLEQLRRAAEQLLGTDQVEAGREQLASVCGALDVFCPVGPAVAPLSQAWTELRLRLRNLNIAAPLGAVSMREALTLRTARSVVTGSIAYWPEHVGNVAGRFLLRALDTGDVGERVRSIGYNAYVQCHVNPASPRSRELVHEMEAVAELCGSVELSGFASWIQGARAFHLDRCREARRCFERASRDLSDCSGVSWELDLLSVYDQLSASQCGDYADIARATPALVDEALRRGRVWTGAMLSGLAGMPAWMTEGPAAYRRQLAEVARCWKPRSRPLWPDHLLALGEALVCLYEGQPERGVALLEQRRALTYRAPIGGAGPGRVAHEQQLGRCAAAALGAHAPGSAERARWIGTLRRAIKTLTRHGGPQARGMAILYEGVLARDAGHDERSVELLRGALVCFERAGMGMFQAAARRRLGQIVSGDEGRLLVEQGEDFMHAEGIDDLDAETEAHCPGYAER